MINRFKSENRHCMYIAEIGLNHNGSVETAGELIKRASEAGADCVKFQTFVPEKMNSVYTSSLLQGGREGERDSSQVDFFSNYILKEDEYAELKQKADSLGVTFFSSPFDEDSVDLLERIDVPLYKIASSEVTNHRLINRIGETGKPVIISTGMTEEEEISDALEILSRGGTPDIVLLHCVSLYPLPPESANLMRIPVLRDTFGMTPGFSDHTAGTEAASIAASLGARIFEKHFTLNREHPCPDREVSLTAEEFAAYIESVEKAVSMTGTGEISCSGDEIMTAKAARRSIFAGKDIPRGKVISGDDLVLLRPGVGIPASLTDKVIGKKSRVKIDKDFMIREEYLV